ncbi:MAG: tetratricopeptide repeat protein [Pseudomonadota bacterium]
MKLRQRSFYAILLFVSACGTNPYNPDIVESESSSAPIERDTQDTPEPPASNTAQATNTLLASADAASTTGDHSRAINYLERAVRMDPRNPNIWIKLSRAYLQNDELLNATRHARKAIALAAGDDLTTRTAWLTLADIKEAEGNLNEAKSLRRRWSARG